MNHYVDNSVSEAGNGSSWSQAWNSFSAINWSAVRPGDTIYVSGGVDGQTYNETLTVGASGSAAATITITKGVDPGHDGAVVIDGGGMRWNGVVVYARDHVVVSHLDVRNITDAGFSVKYATAGVVLRSNSVHADDAGSDNARGYDVRGSVGIEAVIVTDNSFTTTTSTMSQTDGIYSMENDGVVFEKNHIVISNNNDYGHSDAFQSFRDKNIIVRDNWFEQANTAAYHHHGAWIENTQTGGTIQFHNNVVLTPNLTGDAAVAHYMRSSWAGSGTVEIWNNTIIGGGRALYLDKSPAATVYNNIIQPSTDGHAAVVLNGAPPTGNIDGNLMWSPFGATIYMGLGNLSWSQWQALGYDANGVGAKPAFTNPAARDYTLSPHSPAIDQGLTLSGIVTDYRGTPRQGGHDIGAFEAGWTTPPSAAEVAPPIRFGAPGSWGQDAKVSIIQRDNAGTDHLTFRAMPAWGGVEAARTTPADWDERYATHLAFDNFVQTTLNLQAAGNTSLDLMVIGASHGRILTANGSDTITWNANAAAGGSMVIRPGGGDDMVHVTATNGSAIARVLLDSGQDIVTVEGDARLVLKNNHANVTATGGDANDAFWIGKGSAQLTGGAGRDVFIFQAGSGYTHIEDFTSGTDRLKFLGLTAADISTREATEAGACGLLVNYDSDGEGVFLAHVSALAESDIIFG
jgi:hypothetical protein